MPAPVTASAIPAADPSLLSSDSENDLDFAASQSDHSSDSDARHRKKRKAGDELGSGDEGIIDSGQKRIRTKRPRKKGAEYHGDDDEEGVGARVRRRKTGGVEETPKKTLVTSQETTVDIDAIWARMNTSRIPSALPALGKAGKQEEKKKVEIASEESPLEEKISETTANAQAVAPEASIAEEMILIKRTYEFAGETVTEEKQVPKSSAEARLYLAAAAAHQNPSTSTPNKKPPLRRPKKRTSMFEPPPDDSLLSTPGAKGKGTKLNTIEKSKLDWAGYVDKEGIKDELEGAEKAKDGYLGKRDFLDKMSAKREGDISSLKRK